MIRMVRQWADKYGSQWYKHYDGHPPHDDNNDYEWNGFQWVKIWNDEDIDWYDQPHGQS
jgi:hypothetical protein